MRRDARPGAGRAFLFLCEHEVLTPPFLLSSLSPLRDAAADYQNVFVGHYDAGDVQYLEHTAVDCLYLLYWKTSKSFADGCSAFLKDGYYRKGNIALPDQGAFLIEDVTIDGATTLEANHHCDIGVTGWLCAPHYVFHNTRRRDGVDVAGSAQSWLAGFEGQATVFILSPPNCLANQIRSPAEAQAAAVFLPAGFCALVHSRYAPLLLGPGLDLPASGSAAAQPLCSLAASLPGGGVAVPGKSAAQIGERYAGGILCRIPLRVLKLYSHSLRSSDNQALRVEFWLSREAGDEAPGQSLSRPPNAEIWIPFHQIGDTGDASQDDAQPPKAKQGFSVPVFPKHESTTLPTARLTAQSYRLSLGTPGSTERLPIPADWVVEFSDPVFGNRWQEEEVALVVLGRECGALVSSQHDRRYMLGPKLQAALTPGTGEARGRGACTVHPKMDAIECADAASFSPLGATACPERCAAQGGCGANAFCDCRARSCACEQGFVASSAEAPPSTAAAPTSFSCEVDLCGAARCSSHGVCAARFLGGDLPVSAGACVCESPWSGPLCDMNPCAAGTTGFRACSGHGTCAPTPGAGSLDGLAATHCVCAAGYSGPMCTASCDGQCAGGGGTFPYGCAETAAADTYALQCGASGGCSYPSTAAAVSSTMCTYYSRANKNSAGAGPPCPTENDCRFEAPFVCASGACPASSVGAPRPDGTACNSVPFGTCRDGECALATSAAGSSGDGGGGERGASEGAGLVVGIVFAVAGAVLVAAILVAVPTVIVVVVRSKKTEAGKSPPEVLTSRGTPVGGPRAVQRGEPGRSAHAGSDDVGVEMYASNPKSAAYNLNGI